MKLRLGQASKPLLIILIAISVIGFVDATYLTAKYYSGSAVTCSVLHGCEVVTTSQYSTIFGVPISLAGAVFYLTVSILLIVLLEGRNEAFKLLLLTTGAGFLFTLYLLYLQVFVLEALCLYCLISAATSTTLFAGSLFLTGKSIPGGRSE